MEARLERGGARAADKVVDFKQKWRVQQAVRALKKRYGLNGLRARIALFLLGAIGALVFFILEVLS